MGPVVRPIFLGDSYNASFILESDTTQFLFPLNLVFIVEFVPFFIFVDFQRISQALSKCKTLNWCQSWIYEIQPRGIACCINYIQYRYISCCVTVLFVLRVNNAFYSTLIATNSRSRLLEEQQVCSSIW